MLFIDIALIKWIMTCTENNLVTAIKMKKVDKRIARNLMTQILSRSGSAVSTLYVKRKDYSYF